MPKRGVNGPEGTIIPRNQVKTWSKRTQTMSRAKNLAQDIMEEADFQRCSFAARDPAGDVG